MKIIKVLMTKKLENQEMYSLHRRRQFSYEEHISTYLMALSYLKRIDVDIDKKMKLWKRFLTAIGKSKIRYYRKLLKYRNQENKIILEAFDRIEEMKNLGEEGFGSLYQPFTFGVLSYEFEANE